MKDLGVGSYGTLYFGAIVPEPDSPITVYWGSAMAESVARVTKLQVIKGKYQMSVATTAALVFRGMSRMPFIKVWRMDKWTPTETFTDLEIAGTGNSILGPASQTSWFVDNLTLSSSNLVNMKLNYGTSENDPTYVGSTRILINGR